MKSAFRHSKVRKSLPSALALVLAAGCAAPTTQRVSVSDAATKAEAERQMEIAVDEMVIEQKRLSRVHRLLATRAADVCGTEVGPSHGAFTMTKPSGAMGDALSRRYGVSEVLTVVFVLEGSPAEKAGLKARDLIVKANGISTTAKDAVKEMLEKHSPEAPLQFDVRREGIPLSITVSPEKACKYPALISQQQIINAFADGERVLIARGMMSFARDDNELALVVSHEMAHNVMKHIEAKKQNMALGMLADVLTTILTRGQVSGSNFAQIGAMAYSQEFEAEADYVGLYIMTRAGLPIEDAPKFWRRMAAAHPANIRTNHAASHPSTAYRMVALEETVKEIRDKIAKGAALVPNTKNGKPTAPAKPD